MLILSEYQVCPHKDKCPSNLNHQCYGADSSREVVYKCDFLYNGKIDEGKFRNPLDKTGQMKIIME